MKKCLNCGNEVRPSVVKCNHCGKNPNTPPEDAEVTAGAVAGSPEAPAPAQFPPAGAPVPAAPPPPSAPPPTPGATDPAPEPNIPRPDAVQAPPTSVAFTLPGQAPAAAAPEAADEAPGFAAAPAGGAEAAPSTEDRGGQDWGPAADPKDLQGYWVAKQPPVPGTPMAAAQAQQQFKSGSVGGAGMASAVLILVGGLAAVLAALQPWVTVALEGVRMMDSTTESVKGISGWEGKLTAILGGLAALRAIMWFVAGRKTSGLRAAAVGGVIISGVGIYTMATLNSQFTSGFVDAATAVGMPEDQARGLVNGWMTSGQLTVSAEPWLIATIVAGVVVLVGAILAFTAKSSPQPQQWAPPQQGGL